MWSKRGAFCGKLKKSSADWRAALRVNTREENLHHIGASQRLPPSSPFVRVKGNSSLLVKVPKPLSVDVLANHRRGRATGTQNKKAEGFSALNYANCLILLAPRPGLEPGTYGLTVALKDVLYSSRFSLVLGNLLILIGYEYYIT